MAFREMLLNAIEHGGRLDPNKYVEIEYVRARHMVACHITEPGSGFAFDEMTKSIMRQPLTQPTPIRHVALREEQGMRPSGFGVLLAKQVVELLTSSSMGKTATRSFLLNI